MVGVRVCVCWFTQGFTLVGIVSFDFVCLDFPVLLAQNANHKTGTACSTSINRECYTWYPVPVKLRVMMNYWVQVPRIQVNTPE